MTRQEFINEVFKAVVDNKKYLYIVVYYPYTKELKDYLFELKNCSFDSLYRLYDDLYMYQFKIKLY